MNTRENYLRAVRFEKPEFIPMSFHINEACWRNYPQNALFELMEEHKLLFPDFVRTPGKKIKPAFSLVARAGRPYTDDWGCVWETTENGITGIVKRHPLADWDAFDCYTPPDPEKVSGIGPIDWERIAENFRAVRSAGLLMHGWLRHGHTFLQLCDIRGYENVIIDMHTKEPRLLKLLGMIEEFNLGIVRRYIALGAEMIGYPDDLGTQSGPMLTPEQFRKYIKPIYRRLMDPAHDAGCTVHMHSDGDIRTLTNDIIETGVDVVNLQDLVNGIDWIKDHLAGKTCIDLDIDRQKITRFGTPAQIDALIHEEVTKLGSPKGGLTMIFGLYPGMPLANVKALMDVMEKHMHYYA